MKKGKLTAFISALTLTVSISAITVYAEKYVDEDGTVYYYQNSKITDIIPGEGVEVLNIPGEVGGRPVFSVQPGKGLEDIEDTIKEINLGEGVNPKGDFVFGNFKALEKVFLPYGLETISDMAFLGCKNLEDVNIPKSVKRIGDGSFMNCISLEIITIPNSVEVIGDSAFSGCTSLESFNWNGEAELNSNVFENTPYLENYPEDFLLVDGGKTIYAVSGRADGTVEIPESVTTIRPYTFKGSKVKKIIYPATLDTIPSKAFEEATELEEVEFKGEIKEIGADAFYGCTSLTKPIIPEGITEIPRGCFAYCKGIKSAEIPDNITKIDQYAFAYNARLTDLKLNEGLESIEANAFESCIDLKFVTIPKSVEKIGSRAFNKCISLSSLTVKGDTRIEMAAFCDTALEEKNISLAEGVVYEPVAENEKYEDDPLDFLYDEDFDAEKEPVYATHKPFETETPARATAEPEETENPKTTATPKPDVAPVLVVKNQNGEIEITVKDETVIFPDAKPFIDENDRTQVPVRAVAETLGFTVDYNEGKVTISNSERVITLRIGGQNIVVDLGHGMEYNRMDTTAMIVDDRAYVPIRFVAEMLGYTVEYIG